MLLCVWWHLYLVFFLQNEEPLVWTSAQGRDLQALQGNFFYNFPQGQQVNFSPAHSGQGPLAAGMYHLPPTTAAPSMVQSLPPQHSQALVAPSVESVVPPSGTYQQPHSQINWNPKLLNRENIWEKKKKENLQKKPSCSSVLALNLLWFKSSLVEPEWNSLSLIQL